MHMTDCSCLVLLTRYGGRALHGLDSLPLHVGHHYLCQAAHTTFLLVEKKSAILLFTHLIMMIRWMVLQVLKE